MTTVPGKTKKGLELLFVEVVTEWRFSSPGGIFRGENFSFGFGVVLMSAGSVDDV